MPSLSRFCFGAAGLHSPLKQLDLSFNQLGDRAARALASMMAAVPLLALELEGNQVWVTWPHRGAAAACVGSAYVGVAADALHQSRPGLRGLQLSGCGDVHGVCCCGGFGHDRAHDLCHNQAVRLPACIVFQASTLQSLCSGISNA